MHKKTTDTIGKNAEMAALVAKTARICKVSKRYVRYVRDGYYRNDQVFGTFMTLLEETRDLENRLLKEVEKLVPFN